MEAVCVDLHMVDRFRLAHSKGSSPPSQQINVRGGLFQWLPRRHESSELNMELVTDTSFNTLLTVGAMAATTISSSRYLSLTFEIGGNELVDNTQAYVERRFVVGHQCLLRLGIDVVHCEMDGLQLPNDCGWSE